MRSEETRLRPDQAGWFVDRLWPGQPGEQSVFAACAFGRDPYYDDHGKFSHRRWDEEQFRWPRDRHRLLTKALAVAEHGGDAYVCPLLMSCARRKQEHAQPGRFSWVDIDSEIDDQKAKLIARLLRGDSFLVRSGGGVHLYIALDAVQSADVVTAANYRLKTALAGDHKHAANSLLRLPGTVNTKPVPRGGEALRVEVLMRG
jgi:hypothetical protein